MTDPPDHAAAVAAAVRSIHAARTQQGALETVVAAAREAIPGFDAIGVSTIDAHGNARTRARSDDLVDVLDTLQFSLREGPCFDTVNGERIVSAPRIHDDRRWPRYVPWAVTEGLCSQLAVRLYLDGRGTVGGLNLYSTLSEEIDPEAVRVATLFADHAAVALGYASQVDGLSLALRGQKVIGEAIGILMERYDVGEDRAVALLVRAATSGNSHLHDIARQVVDGHDAT